MTPSLTVEKAKHTSLLDKTTALRDLSVSGAHIGPDDPVVNEIRGEAGLSPVDLEGIDLNLGLIGIRTMVRGIWNEPDKFGDKRG